MDKFLKDLFSKPLKKKGHKNKRNKYLFPKKIITAVIATIFLITVVLFSQNIDQILKFFGVRADQATIELSLDPEGSLENGTAGDPPYDSAQDAGPGDTLVWEINVKSIWGTHPTSGETQPFEGTIKFIPPDFSGTPHESFIENVRIEVPEHPDNTGSHDINYPGITITGSSDNCPPLSIFPCNWRPIPNDQEFVSPPVKLIIQITDYDPELGGFSIDFEVGAGLEYNPYMNPMSIPDPDDPGGTIPPPVPAEGTINLDGPLPEPDFTLEIISPEATLPEDIHELTVDGGDPAVYIIEINPNEYFGIAGDGIIDLSVPVLDLLVGDGLPIASYNFLPESPLTRVTGNIEDTDQIYVTLTIYTNATDIQHSIDFDIIGYSDQTDSYIQLGWPPIPEPHPDPYPYEMTRRDNARLIINPTPRYTIDITEKQYALPGGDLNYIITLKSFNDLSGNITLDLKNIDPLIDTWILDNGIDLPVAETAIVVALPANGTITADLTATLVTDANWQGNYHMDGFIVTTFPNTPIIPPPYPEVHGFFGIWDFNIFVTPESLDVNPIPPAGTANYLITVERYGMNPSDLNVTSTNDVYWGDIRLEAYVKGTLTLLGDDDAIASATITDTTLTILNPYITNAVGEIIIIQTTNLVVIAVDDTPPNLPEVITIVEFEVFGTTTHTSYGMDADLTRSDDSRVIIQKTAYFTIDVIDTQPRTIPGGQTEFDVRVEFFNNYPNSIELTANTSHISINTYKFNTEGIDTPLTISPINTTVKLYLDTNDAAVAETVDVDVAGRDIVDNNTETKSASVQIVDFIIDITTPLFDGTAHTREVIPGDVSTTYIFNVKRLNNLTEEITLSAKLDEISLPDLSSHSSITSVEFTGADIVKILGEYILQYTDLLTQEVTMTVFFDDPIPTEEINFHIYGDTVVEGDPWQKQSNLARINIDNNYDFRLAINGPFTVAPTGMAEYIITGEWQFGFEEDINIDNAYLSIDGTPSGNLLSSNSNINNLIVFPDGKILTLANPTIRMQITADVFAIGEDISFMVHGTANLDGTGIRDRYTNETNIKIIDFEIVNISPTTDDHRTVGSTAELVEYTIILRSTGTTDFDRLINLSTDINIIDDDVAHYDIINIIDLPASTTNITPSGITIILRAQTKNIPNNTIPNHSIDPFTVVATSSVGLVNLSNEIKSSLWFENDSYFTLEITPEIGYSFPGDTAEFDINVIRYYGYNNIINLSISALWPSFINSGNIYFEIQDSTNPNIWYRRDYMNPDETVGKLFIPVNDELLGVLVELNNEIEFTVIGNLGQPDSAADNAKLRIKDFNIRVELKNPPHSNNEVYPNSQIVYNVILTRYNTYLEYTEDISLSNVFIESNYTDYIDIDGVNFENNGRFYALDNGGSIIDILEMYIDTNSNANNLPQTFNFNVTATGEETGLARTAGNRLVIVEAPDFGLTITPKDGIFSGIPTETVTYIVELTREGTFTEDVTVDYDTDLNSLYYDSITWQDGNNVFRGSDIQKELYVKFSDQEGYTGDHLISVSGISISFPVPKPSNSTLLRLMDFGITVVDNPAIKSLTPSNNDTWTINLTRYNHYDRAVEVRLDWIDNPAPNIDTWGFDLANDTFPAQIEDDSAFLTIYTTDDETERTIMFNVIGKDIPSELERSDIGGVNIISAPYYELTLTPIVNRGIETETLSYTIEITWLNGFDDPVDIEEVILSDSTDIIYYFEGDKTTLTTDGDTTILYLDLGSGIDYGIRTVNVIGNDNGSVGKIPATDQDVIIMDFEIRLNPDNHLISDTAPNNVAVYTVELYRYEGYDRNVTLTTDLTVENYGDILSSSEFENNGLIEYTGQEMDTLNLTVVAKSAANEFGFNVTGTDQFTASVQRSATGTLTIVAGVTPSFIINIAPNSRTIPPGGITTYTVTAQRNNFNEIITLTHNLYEIDDRIEFAEFNTNQLVNEEDEAILTVVAKVDADSEDSYRTFNVNGNGGGLQDSDSAEFKIYEAPDTPPGGGTTSTAKDFSIDIEPDEQTVMAGDTTTYTIIINRTNFTGDILLNNTIADNPNIKSAILNQSLIDNDTDTVALTVITEADAEASTVMIIVDGTAIIDRRETERSGEAVLYIRREEAIEEIIVPEEELPSTGPELTWLLLGLAALLMTTITYRQLQFNFEYKENE